MSKLTAIELNKIIVNFRKIINIALVHIAQKLKSQIDRYKKSLSPKKKRRIERYVAEIKATNKLRTKKDDITKFALINVKSFQEFGVTNNVPPETVVKYKVATSNIVLKEIDKIRKTYKNWFQEIPFILQRFSDKKNVKKLKEKVYDDSNTENNEKNSNIEVSDYNNETNFIENDNINEDDNEFNNTDSENNDEILNIESNETTEEKKTKLNNKKVKKLKKLTISKKLQKNVFKQKLNFKNEKNDLSILEKKQNNIKLHPSWEAAKLNKQKTQEVIKNALNNGKTSGKHIKFD